MTEYGYAKLEFISFAKKLAKMYLALSNSIFNQNTPHLERFKACIYSSNFRLPKLLTKCAEDKL